MIAIASSIRGNSSNQELASVLLLANEITERTFTRRRVLFLASIHIRRPSAAIKSDYSQASYLVEVDILYWRLSQRWTYHPLQRFVVPLPSIVYFSFLRNVAQYHRRRENHSSVRQKKMRRGGKYKSNQTVRFCLNYRQRHVHRDCPDEFCVNKRNHWKLINLLKAHRHTLDFESKIVVRRNCHFYQYNGYKPEKRSNPPRHLFFAGKPSFVYQPYVHFIKVNQEAFSIFLRDGLPSRNGLEQLLDIECENTAVTLIYFLDGSSHCYSSDWYYACKHAYGGYFADYHTVCLGDFCPFGPKISGEISRDPRIREVLFINEKNRDQQRCGHCLCSKGRHAAKFDWRRYKVERSQLKSQRRLRNQLTKQVHAKDI